MKRDEGKKPFNIILDEDLVDKAKQEAHERGVDYLRGYSGIINEVLERHYKQRERNTAKKIHTKDGK